MNLIGFWRSNSKMCLHWFVSLMILLCRWRNEKYRAAKHHLEYNWVVDFVELIFWPGSITWVFVTGTKTGLLPSQNQLCYYSSLESWQPCYIPTPDAYILGGGTATLAQRIQNGFRKILQVLILSPSDLIGYHCILEIFVSWSDLLFYMYVDRGCFLTS